MIKFYNVFILIVFWLTRFNSYGGELELQISSGNKQAIEIYNERGTKISDCQGANICTDPLPRDAKISYYNQVYKTIYNPITGKREQTLLYKVRYGYKQGNMWISGYGWINAGYTNRPHLNSSSAPMQVVTHDPTSKKTKSPKIVETKPSVKDVPLKESIIDTPTIQKNPKKKDSIELTQGSNQLSEEYLTDLEIIHQRIENNTAVKYIKAINRDSSKLINAGIGKCIATENEIKEKLHSKWENKEFIYDEIFLPEALKLKASHLNIRDENNNPISDQDLREIDILARTIYAEVSNCFVKKIRDSNGKVIQVKETFEYPMFVAATAKNRVDYIENIGETTEFVKGGHNINKGIYAKVLTTSLQYSPWNKPKPKGQITNAKIDYNALRHLLCPPSKINEVYYLGSNPPAEEVGHFKIAVKMAMEAVLYPTLFSARAHEFWQFYFTSNKQSFYGMQELIPSIHGRKLDNKECINVWDGLPAGFTLNAQTKKTNPDFYKFVERRLNQNKVDPDSISSTDTGRKRRANATYHFYETIKNDHAELYINGPQNR